MHASCAVLMVTGNGAMAYAEFYGFRLIGAKEWVAQKYINESEIGDKSRWELPVPVINYPPQRFGIRGINEIAEWGLASQYDYVILGQSVSSMVGDELILSKHPDKYYTDTSFRVAKSLEEN